MKIFKFKPDDDEREAIEKMLSHVTELAAQGEVADAAVVWISHVEGEPTMFCSYYGKRQFGSLLGAIDMLKFDMLANQHTEEQ